RRAGQRTTGQRHTRSADHQLAPDRGIGEGIKPTLEHRHDPKTPFPLLHKGQKPASSAQHSGVRPPAHENKASKREKKRRRRREEKPLRARRARYTRGSTARGNPCPTPAAHPPFPPPSRRRLPARCYRGAQNSVQHTPAPTHSAPAVTRPTTRTTGPGHQGRGTTPHPHRAFPATASPGIPRPARQSPARIGRRHRRWPDSPTHIRVNTSGKQTIMPIHPARHIARAG